MKSGMPGLSSTERRLARSIISTAETGARLQPDHRPAARIDDAGEQHQRARLVGVFRDSAVGDLGDEAERALRADHQVLQDVDRVGEVDQRVEAVAGGVLDRVLAADARQPVRRRRGCARASSSRASQQPRVRCGERGAAGRVGGVQHGAVGQASAACRHGADSCSAPCRSTCRWRCWRRCRRSCRR